MSSRYPSNDSRYTSRDRTPPRYTDRRTSVAHGSSFVPRNDDVSSSRTYPDSISGSASRDVPRGPKALADSSRGPPPGGGSSVPAGPRGRGFGGRSEYRELRDAPPLSDGRGGSSWRGSDRDRHFDRRDRAISPRARSPGRDSRDSRDSRDFPPRELDIDRARRSGRDGPPSAGSNYSDPPSSQFGFYGGRGGFGGRGRGRGDWDDRGRGRGTFADRNSFRPRSRSPRPRWDKDSRDDRISDRRDDRRFDRRDDDRPFYRDDREVDRYKRDPVPRDADIRRASVVTDGRYGPTPNSNTHHSPRHSSISVGHSNNSAPDLTRDLLPSRRTSVAQEPSSTKTHSDKPEYIAARAEASRDRYGPRASSPPPSAPQVPAFGSVASFQKPATTFSTPTSNVWRPPPQPPTSSPASAPSKIPPSAPKAPSSIPPTAPTGPKASRPLEKPVEKPVEPPASSPVKELAKSRIETPPAPASQPPPAPRVASAEPHDTLSRSRPPSPPAIPPTGPAALQPRLPATVPPTGPRGLVSPQQPHSRLVPPLGPPRDVASSNIPLGPRATVPFSTPPRGPSAGPGPPPGPAIPTGPKADRAPPAGPRAALGPNNARPPMMGVPGRNLQWIRPDAPRYGRPSPVVPAKRDYEGDEKEKGSSSRPRSPAIPMGSPVSGPATPSPAVAAEPVAQRRRSAGEIRSRDEPSSSIARRNSAFASSDPVKKEDSPSPPLPKHESQSDEASEDDDEMDLDDEDFFGQSKITYEREKSRLEARLKNLQDASLRFLVPLRSLLRLSRVADAHIPQPDPVVVSKPTPAVETVPEPERVEQPAIEEEKPEEPDVPMEDEKEDKASPVVETPAAPEPEPEPPKLPTPKADEHEDIEMPDLVAHRVDEDVEDETSSTSEDSITEAQLQSLPYLHRGPPTPLSDPDQEAFGLKPNVLASIKGKLMEACQAEREFQDSALQTFRVVYKEWGLETAQREKELVAREEKEKTEEQETAVSPTEPALGNQPVIRQRHVTDYDLENIMKESMRLEEERKEKQRREEEAKNPFSGGQAPIPDMLPEEELRRSKFVNTNRLREPSKGIITFGFEPPDDDFAPEEHKALVVAYHQTPKDWGEIAKALPGRDFRECIAHYYSTKWNGEYKPPTGRRKAKRKAPANPRKTKPPFASTEKDDVAGEDGVPASTTERGRPRRAAAPTFGDKEVQEHEHATPTPTPGRQRGTSTRGETVEPTTEKPTKRQRATKEKGNKKSRTQNLAPAPSASPQKMDRDIKDMYQADVPGDLSHLPRTSEDPGMLPAPSQLEIPHLGPDAPMLHPAGATEPAERPRARTANSRAGGMSSYWSVNESTDFRNYLSYFGTDFAAIARQMGTKTPAMVKNEYTRKTDTGKNHELIEIAQTADEKRKRGEDMGPPPPPTASTKRRDYTSQPPIPRTLAPTPSDAVDDSRSPTKQPEVPPQTSSPLPQAMSRFPPLAQAAPPMSTAAIQPAVSGPAATQAPPHHHGYARPQHDARGPARGYFSQREPTRPPLIQPEVRQHAPEPMRDMHPEHHQIPFGQGMPQSMQDQRYPRLAVDHREREVMPEPVTTALHPQASFRTGSKHLVRDPRSDPPTPNTEPRPPVHLTAIPRQPPPLRHLVETPSQLPVAQGPPHHVSRPPSPKREEPQPPFVSQAPTPAQAPPRPAEPPRRSNLADLLNPTSSEPSKPKEPKIEERPSVVPQERPFSAQGRPIRQTGPPPQPASMASSSPAYHRGELFVESPKPGSPFARPAYVQPPAQQMSVPPSSRRNMEPVREQSQPPPARDWARPSFSQPPQSSSPHPAAMQPQPPLTIDTRSQQFPVNHRAALSQLNGQQRNMHSPTPSHTPVAHSRTPSYSHAQPARQQAPTPIPHGVPAAPSPAREMAPGPVLQSNPYAQMTPPQNIQQPAAPLAQQIGRNDAHSRNLSYNRADERAYDGVRGRDRALMEQERREYEFAREREVQVQSIAQARAVQAQAEAQRHDALMQQHFLRQPTPTQADQAAARYSSAGPGGVQGPSRGSAHTPTGHMGYPPPPAPPGGPQLGLPPPGPASQQDRHAPPHHSFPSPFPSAAQRGFEAMTRAEEAQYLRQQEVQHVQHAQAHAAHAQAQAHADQRYREEAAAAQAAHQHAAQQAQAQAVQQQQIQQHQQAAAAHAAAAEQDLHLRRNHAHAAHAAAAHHHSQQQQQPALSEAMAEKERRDRDHRDREHHHRARQSQAQAEFHMSVSAARAQQQQQQQQAQAHQQHQQHQHAAQPADMREWQRIRDRDRDVFGGRDGRSGLFGPGPRKA